MAKSVTKERLLRNQGAVSNAIELLRRRNLDARLKNRVEEIKHLSTVDRAVPRHEDKHVARLHDFLVFAGSFFAGRPNAQYFIRCHEGTLDLHNALIDVVCDWGHSRTRKCKGGFLDSLNTRHFAEQFGSFVLVWGESHPDLTIAHNALVRTVLIHDLADILSYEIGFQSKTGHIRKSVGEDLHTLEGWEFVDEEEQAVLVVELTSSLEIEFFREIGRASCRERV